MASDKKAISVTVKSMIDELKANPSKRFSKNDYQMLVYAICSDEDFKVKKHVLRGDTSSDTEYDVNAAMCKLFDKLLKHAGMGDATERMNTIKTFQYSPKDMEWVSEAVDEAMYIYAECDKNLRVFRDKMIQLTLKKMVRSGKYAGKATYKKTVIDRTYEMLATKE